MRTLLIDNYDSFTYNLYDLLHRVNGIAPHVVTNDTPWSEIHLGEYDCVVVSPGPGRPQEEADLGVSLMALKQTQVPVLGICLGHQGLSHLLGARVKHAVEPVHGRVSEVHHASTDLFAHIPSPFDAVRYHSLAVSDLPSELEPLAWTADGVVMAARNRNAPQWGVQFHPESILTEYGEELLHNFRKLVMGGRHGPAEGEDKPEYRVEHREIDVVPDTEVLFTELYGGSDTAFWLDSSDNRQSGRFSILGDASGPLAEYLEYSVRSRRWIIQREGRSIEVDAGFFDYLEEQLDQRRVGVPDGLPFDFNLGYVGALGYELKAQTGGRAHHTSPRPDSQLVFADRAVVVDHLRGRTHLLALATNRSPEIVRYNARWFAEMARRVRDATDVDPVPVPEPPAGFRDFRFDQLRPAYLDSVRRSLKEITDGESYEICLTNTAESEPIRDPLGVYRRLRSLSPVPFGAFLRMGEISVLSASPERFLRIGGDRVVQAKPIKGTRPRGGSEAEDAAIVRDLATSTKDQAENLMIVDLLRNDLNRVCVVGSVHVPKLFDIESYAHVHQMVSTIEGRLAPDRTAVGCVRSCFPGGSMTGAPKVRTMEIIDDLEHRSRGYYSGAVGWFSLAGAADLNIVIRTLVSDEHSCTFGVGGAIVSLSDPEEEYEETLVKSRAVLAALDARIEETS